MKRNHSMISWAVLVCFVLLMVLEGPVTAVNQTAVTQQEDDASIEEYISELDQVLSDYPMAEDTIAIDASATEETVNELESCGFTAVGTDDDGCLLFETEFATRRLFVAGSYDDSYGAVCELNEPYSDTTILQYDTIEACFEAYTEMCSEGVDVQIDEELEPVECYVPGYSSAFSETTAALGYDEMQKNPEYQKNTVVISYLGTGITDVFNNGRLAEGINVIDSDATDTTDIRNHDTGCATVIFDSTPDNIKVMPVRFYNTSKTTTISAVVAAYWHALYNSDILCTSVIFTDLYAEKEFLDGALAYASENNKPICISAGNQTSSCTKYYPNNKKESYSALWVVGGVSASFDRYTKSNYNLLDFSSMAVSIKMLNNYGNVYTANGTSMASPYLASAAAMLMASGKYTSMDAIYAKLKSMCKDLGDPGYDAYYGWGVPVYDATLAETEPEPITHEHTLEEIPAVAATCTQTGLSTGKKCTECGEVVEVQKTVAALGHTLTDIPAVDASCTTSGLTAGKKCSRCGEITVSQTTVAALGHSYETLTAINATCTGVGMTEGKRCVRCGEIAVMQTSVPALGHDLEVIPAVPATCTVPGLTAGEKCRRCGVVVTPQKETPALGHSEVVLQSVNATCTESGLTEGKACSRCNEVLVAQEVIPAAGHAVVALAEQAASCIETGMTAGASCSICGTVLEAREVIPAQGHSIAVIEAVEPTCTEVGHTAGTYCSVCDEILEAPQELAALGHTIDSQPAIEPTCTECGMTSGGVCSVCGYIETAQQEIPALGHQFDHTVAVAPSCTECGMTEGGRCTVCGYVVGQEEIPATGHTPIPVQAIVATCTRSGLTEGSVCEVCGEVLIEQESIPAFGHTSVVLPAVAAGCLSTGLTEGAVCETCGELLVPQTIIPATGHTPRLERKEPVGITPGYERSVCEHCGEILSETVLPAAQGTPTTALLNVSMSRKKVTMTGVYNEYVNRDAYYTVTGHGFLYIRESKLGARELTVTTSGRTKVSSMTYRADGSYTYTFTGDGNAYIVRSWISYKDANGKTVYVYSDPVRVK